MIQRITHVTIVVKDYDDAIKFYTEKLNFDLLEDTRLSEVKRWVIVAPQGDLSCSLVLAKSDSEEQKSKIGNQTGGRVFLFLYTDNFEHDYKNLIKNGVEIVREPRIEEYGKVLVFSDLYGNLWDLIEPLKRN